MILKGLFQNKKGLIQKSMTLIFIAFALFALIFLVYNSKYASAAKSDQFFIGNFTCESFEDALLWSAVGQKSAPTNSYFGWVPAVGCNSSINTVGPKACDIHKIQSFVRYSNIGTANSLTTGQVYAQIANTTQSNETNPSSANFTLARYFARLNETVVAGDVLGPRYECGIASDTTSINRTCQVNGSGYDNSTFNYSVRLFADGAANGKTRALIDVFNIKYDWCWTPIIYDAVVTPDIADNETTFTFTINVTNPGATTNVSLFTAPLGSNEWVQEGATQTCIDCAQKKLTFNVNFGNRIGKRIFKFNATDGTYGTEAGNPAHLGTATNECLDTDNDCQFEVTQAAAAQGTPNIINETVNGVQSGAVEGWGTNWTFSVNVSNPPDGAGDINVTLFVNTGSGFIQKASANCTAPCSSSTKFTFFVDDFQCSDISSAQYRFTATNLNGTTTVTHPFTIERDDVIIEHIQGNNSIANRSGNQIDLLIVRVFDSDKAPSGAYIGSGTNVTFNVKFDDVNFDAGTNRTTNSSGYANYSFDPTCSPTKYQVGNREWKASTSGDSCYKDVTSSILNLSIAGDIILTFNEPDGSSNFTQEDEITFLGATTDDCGDALVTTVKYYANSSQDSFACTSTTQIGANAFQCKFLTSLSTKEGYYNTTMFANASKHYDNFTKKTATNGLFYILPKKKFTNLSTSPTKAGWGRPNWNFSVLASSGDANNVYQIDLYLAQSINPTTTCESTGNCQNQTPKICYNCINTNFHWLKNFTASDQGTWFYQFKFNDTEGTSTSGTANFVTVTKDDTNISYGGQGNATTVIKDTQPQNLSVRVFDIDKNSYNVTLPSANVTFKLLDPGYAGGEKIIGYALTNETGHATFLFNVTECNFQQGTQKWIGEILSTEPNYNVSKSENFTITLDLTGCEPSISVENVITPTETFQNINFTINSTIAAFISTANNVNVTLNVPSGWIVGPSVTQSLGSVAPGTPKTVSWTVNATSYGRFNVSVFANSSDAGNDTLDSSNFQVYKEALKGTADSPTLPSIVQAGGNITASWQCSVGDYRVATLNINANTSSSPTTIRVLTYNGTDFVDVLHSKFVDTNNTIKTIKVPLLSKQIDSNETGFCNLKIFNLGSNSINITDISLEAYYNETVSVRDVQASVNGVNTTGIESSETLFNVSAILDNSINQSFLANVTLNITNSSGVVFTSTNNNINIPALGSIQTNFININTSNWSVGNYSIEVYAVGNFTKANNKTEILIFNNVEIYADSTKYICNSTTETFNVTIFHPFTDTIQYNISLEMPSGWSYSGAQTVNISTIGNHSFIFNITSSNAAAENATINATINYSYPGINKLKKTSFNIEEGNNIPILEIIRESPKVVSTDRVFESSLTVHNKGCGTASGAIIKESLSTGWTPANPGILTNEFGQDVQLVSAVTDLEANVITWTLGQIQKDRYAVLTYQVKSPTSIATVGGFSYTSSWDGGRTNNESTPFRIQVMNYTEESHLQFELKAVQQSAFPQAEVRSVQPNKLYNYTLKVTNIGDINATNWNVTLRVPSSCDVPSVYQGGSYNSTSGVITWQLPELGVRPSTTASKEFNFTVNCTSTGSYRFYVNGIKDTRTQTSFSNNTGIGCSFSSGKECSSVSSFTFSKPSNARYEKLSSVNATIFYNFTDFKMTVGEGAINFSDDFNKFRILWQNYSITTPDGTSGTIVANYTLDSSEQDSFVNSARNIGVRAYVDATSSAKGNVTLQKIDYTWNHGKLFNESQNFYTNVKVYVYNPLLQNAKLYINNPNLDPNFALTSANTSSERTGGWGETFNFSVEVRDRFSRNVTIYAWHEKEGGGFKQIGNFTCISCDNNGNFVQVNFSYDYNETDISGVGGWNFKFNATNPDGSSELLGFTYTVEKDDINTNYISPANEVNINRNETTVFSVRVFDRDLGVYPNGSLGKIYISTVGHDSLFESTPPTLTSDNGFLNRTITNSFWCSEGFFLGKHGWYGGTEGDSFVKNNLTKDYIGIRNFTLVGSLINSLTSPSGNQNFTRGSLITFTGSVIDDCNAALTASTTIVYNISRGSFSTTCTADATGSCSIQTNSSFPLGFYNVTMTSNKTGYNNGILFSENLFFLGTVPQLDNPRKTPTETVVAWGKSPLLFEVNVTNIDNTTTTVQLWIKNSSSSYFLENSTQCTNCNNFVFATYKNFTHNNIAGNEWRFKFNATSVANTNINETQEIVFNITTDDIGFSNFGGNNSIVNRSDANPGSVLNLTTTITDLILNQNVLNPSTPNISLSELEILVFNGTDYLVNSSEEFQNGTTNFYRQFNPGCNYEAGSQNWIVNVSGSPAYTDNSTSAGLLKVQIYGDINSSYISPTAQQAFERGAIITFVGTLKDDCNVNLTSSDVSFNLTLSTNSSISYLCGPVTNSTGNTYSCNFDTTGKEVGVYNVTMISSKAFHNNGTDFEANAFEIKSTPKLKDARIDITNDGWGVPRTFFVNVTDNIGDTVNVSLWQDLGSGYQLVGSKTCTSCSNTVINFTTGYFCSNFGSGKTFKFNATDTEGNSYETTIVAGDYRSGNSFVIDRDDVLIEYFFGNESVVNLLNSSEFIVRVYDSDNQTYNLLEPATVTFNVTKQGIGSSYTIVGTNTTNSTGYARFFFTPDQTFQVTKQNWLGYTEQQTCYSFATSSAFNVTTLTNAPQLVNETVSPQTAGWGIQRTFNITVKDTNNTAEVYLWRASSLSGPWILMNSSNYTNVGNFQTLSFVQTFDPSLIGTWFFKFNSTNAVGNKNSTIETTLNNFTLNKNQVLLEYVAGHNSISNRSGNQTTLLSFRVQDENGTYLANFPMRFHVQTDGVNFFTAPYFVVLTNSSGYANFNFNATCSGDVAGAPKFLVGPQQWKITVNESKLDAYQQNDSSSFLPRNTTVWGDILLSFNTPDGSQNFTQEQPITFLGATTDDCGDALVTTVKYYANSSEDSFACTSTTQIGANAFQCVYTTSLSDTRGYYNTTMLANRTLHYDNQTSNVGNPGLFYLFPRKKLTNPTANPTAEGWGKPNWNFSVLASSGDIDNVLQVNLFMAQSVNPTTQCTSPTCQNQTPIICDSVAGCSNQLVTYYRNFTASDQGTWFFQFKFNDTELTSTSGTEFSVVVEKDDTNISYGGQGNATTVIKDTQPQNLSVRVFDLDKNSYNVTLPSANVTFKLLDPGYAGGEKIIGYALTNETGHATFLFNVTECNFQQGTQKWIGEILSTEPNYKPSKSENFTITINLPGCEATVSVENVITPTETFQNINFTINSTIAAFISTANDVNVTLNVPSGWIVGPSATQSLGSVVPGTPKTVSWTVNATSYGRFNVSVFANSSDAGNDTLDSSNFQVYKEELKGTALSPTLPSIVQAGGNITASWQCSVGDYRVATLNINANTSSSPTTIRVLTYNGTDFVDVLHSKSVDTNNTIKTIKVPLLSKQIDSNETGFCNVKIFNLGSNSINITDISLEAYYNETVSVRDVQASVNGVNTTGIESSETLFNVSAILANSINQSFLANVTLNITNSSGVVFTSTNNNINIPALGSIQTNFININTSNWSVGNYSIEVYAVGNFTKANNKTEILIFNNVEIYADSTKYICNSTTETFNVTIFHPFTDTIQYNISLEMPSGWSYSGAQTVNISTIGNHSFIFNITSSNAAAENATINATINYSYPGINKLKKTSFNIEEGNNIPILEIIRESPKVVSTDRVFESSLTVHNKGCGTASGAIIKESLSTGWTPANPGILTNEFGQDVQLVSAVTDLEANVITWTLGQIQKDRYAVLTYQVKSPTSIATVGGFSYTSSWDGGRTNNESTPFRIQVMNYTEESHLQFELKAVQQSAFPQAEVRSVQPNKLYNYTLKVTNIGDINATNWNVTLRVPLTCNVPNVYQGGSYNSTSGVITWQLPELGVRPSTTASTEFNFTVNCTSTGSYRFYVNGIKDTRTQTSFSNNTGIGCSFSSGNECSSVSSFTFSKPSNARYEKLSSVNATIFYNFTDFKMTVGEGAINFSDDFNKFRILWQNYSITTPDGTSGTVVANYTLDSSEQDSFVNSARNIGVRAYVDATSSAKGNVTLQKIDYTWDHGKLFNESQSFYTNVKVYVYNPLLQNAKLYINNPNLDPNFALTSANTSSERTGGWGETFNFSVEVRDRFSRNVTIYAWHEKEGGGFKQIGNFTCISCDNNGNFVQVNFSYDYNESDITGVGGWNFKFNATNPDGSSELLGFTYTVEKDDINTSYVSPANEVNINRNETTVFSVRVFDRDLGVYPNGSLGKIYISTVGHDSLFESTPPTLISDNGFLNRTITNSFWCSEGFFLGKHGWYGGTEGDSFVKNNLTKDYIGIRNFTLVGSLINSLTSPSGNQNFTRGSLITFTGSVIDDCNAALTASTTIVYNISRGSFSTTCTADATGSCSIQTNSSFPLGFYNVTMTSNKTGYNNGILFSENLFFLGTVPQLDNPRKTPTETVVAWGKSPLLFEVNVTNIDNTTTTVQLWIKNSSSSYFLENSTQCTNCNNFVFATYKNFTHNNIAGNEWRFKFNATSVANTNINETQEIVFNITTDDIGFSNFGGNNSIVNRSDANPGSVLNLTTTITDLILNQNVLNPSTPNISLSELEILVFNGTDYLVNSSEEFQNGTTNFYRQFNPGCNYEAGSQNWIVNVSGSPAYTDNSTSAGLLKVQIYGDINSSYISPTAQQAFERGAIITFVGTLKDDCNVNLTSSDVSFNLTLSTNSSISYLCGPVTNSTGNTYSCNFDTTGKEVGVYNVTMISSKAFHNNGTDFEANAFEIKSTPKLKDARIDITNDGWGVPRTFFVNVTDNIGDTVNVSLWQDLGSGYQLVGSKTCTSCSNTVINFTTGYFCSNFGSGKTFKFNATDTEGNSYETTIVAGDYRSGNSFVIDRDDVLIEYFFGNESVVNLLNSSEFIVRVYDSDNQTYNLLEPATVTFNVTKQGIGSSYTIVGTNTTNSTGYARFFFTPDQTFQVTKQNWLGYTEQQTCYSFATSSAFNVTTLTNAPQLVNETVSPQTAGWGIQRTFNITVKDTNNTAEVYLWRASSLSGPWILMNSSNYTNVGNFQTLSFVQTFDPSLIGTWFFKFNSTNAVGNKNSTIETTLNNFTLNKNQVLLEYVAGHNSISNRSGNQTTLLSFRVQDENGTYLANFPMRFHVQTDGVNFFTAPYFVVLTNSSGYANFNFNATCSGDVAGAPKFLVGPQQWKITVNESKLDAYQQNDSSSFLPRNTTVWGDILLSFNTPDGSQNFTQEQPITFLGATTDDCGDALVTTVKYYANSSEDSFACTSTTQIGANAFQCVYTTSLSDTRGYYNTTMLANRTLHYDNQTSNVGNPGLFYLFPRKKLTNPTANPTAEGWGKPNWNFSVLASSGDIDNVLQVNLFMAQSVNPTTQCTSPTCQNQTPIICDAVAGCSNQLVTYYRNFTASDQGTWFFQFKFNDTELTSTSGTEFSVVVEKDDTNISYGGQGNATTVIKDTQPQNLSVRVFDLDKNSYNVTLPSANVTFKLLDPGYAGGEKIIGYALTNETGHATFLFNVTECNFQQGTQKWIGEILSTEPNYKPSKSENFTITINLPGCEATVSVENVITPTETFQNINFTINSTIAAFISTANDVNVTLNVPSGWIVGPSATQSLGSVVPGTPKTVSWTVNATSYGRFNVSVFANSSDAGNDTLDSSNFQVYKEELKGTALSPTLPSIVQAGGNITASWQCSVGDYRVATLNINANTSSSPTTIRVLTYNGTDFVDVLHSKSVDTNNTIKTIKVPLLSKQIDSNETGFCNVKIFNLGSNSINITDISLEAYYNETVSVRDVQASVNGVNTTGIESSETLFNVSAILANSINQSFLANVTLNITNSSGVVFTSTNNNINIPALGSIQTNFININTSNWSVGNYSIEVYAVGNFTKANNKTEILIFNNVEIYADSTKYICNSTTETFNVTIFHPFTDTIQYNISLEMPSGWSYSGAQTVNISTIGNHSFIFNITSSNAAAENATINATINYSYPGINKLKKTSFNIEEGNNIPILEIIRESPRVVSSNTEFVSRLIVYNKGCALANSISLTEKVSSGWTAYTPSIDGVLGGIADIPKGEIRYTENDLGTIRAKEYKVLSYFIFSPSGLNEIGKLRYNLTWGSRNNYEPTEFTINTSKYTKESHLSYNIRAVGSFKDRSAEKDENQLYEFNVTNIGDFNITNATWNVSLSIPNECSPSNYTGIFNSTTRKITWPLGTLNVSNTKSFFLNLNCTVENRFVLVAEGTNDTRTQTSFSNNTGIGCSFSSGNECSSVSSFTFSKPSNARYEKLSSVNATIFYNFTDFKMTVGEGAINFSDDFNKFRILWQNYSITTPDGTSGTVVANYTLDSSEQDSFVNSARNIGVRAYVDATSSAKGNVTLQKIDYTWDHGKLFNESQNLFIDIHPFIFDLPTPVLQTPLNNSLQAAVPVGLSWEAISAPQGINITYYVFGDSTNASTLLDVITENLYLWRDLGATQGTFYWKVIASDGTQNKSSEIRQFTLDLCQPNTNFAFALNYPMSYNLTTDTITVWGSNGTGFTAMGNNESNPITFKNIFEFGQAVRGVCAVTNPSSGSYVILSRLELGNVTDPLNTTFVKTTGESLSFNKQLQLNFNATLISGQLTQGGSPFGGSTLSFSGLDAVNQEEGEFYLKPGSKLRLYDTGVLHTITANNSNPFRLYWNGDVIAKASTLQNWYTIRFLGSNNTIDNLILTNMGEGFFPAATQIGVLTNIRPSGIQKGGLMLEGNANSTITSLEVQEATNDILVQNYTGTTNLINANLNFSNINWTTGTFSGKINRKYDYEPTVTDSAGIPISNTSMVLLDTRGEIIFDLFTDSLGKIPKQTITRAIYDYNFKTGDDRGPHTLKIKKYGKTFQSLAKQFSAATIETLQLTNNPFINRTEAQAKNQTGIKFNPPIRVPYGAEIYQNFNTTGKLNNSPITQSEFFAVFGFDGVNENRKLTLVTGSPSANGEFSVNYATGELIFFNDQTGHNVTPVYSYGGNITISTGTASQNCISMSNLYDYMQANLSDVITTVDGITYTMFVNLIIGNNTVGGCIVDPKASIVFEDGYTYSFSPIGGYIDLAGITAGGGTSGSGINPLSIVDSVGSQYNPGDVVDVFSTTYESSTGNLIDATVNVTIFYPNNSILVSGISNKISTGFYKFNTTLPDNSPLGTYGILIRANDSSGNVVNDVLSFKVEQKQISSGFALNMFNTIGSTYGFGDVVKLFTTTVNSSGNLVNSTVNVAVFYPNNTLLNSGQSSLVSTGRFEYSFIAPTVEGTYRINVDANYSGNEAHDTESFIISATSSGGSVSTPQIYVEAPSVVNVNTNFSIVSLINSESGIPVNCDSGANLTIKDSLNGVNVLNETPMTNFALGLYNYTYLASTPSSYLAIVDCIISNVEYKGIKAFSTQGVPLPKKAVVEMSDFDEVLAGKNFRAKIWIFDQNGVPINADSTPTITLYDPLRNIIVQNVSMTQISTGIYEYNFTTSSGLTGGVWEAIANVVVNGINYQPSDFWELESSPAQVKINSIVDNTIPTITADVTITNEGSGAQEYQYEYCIVSEQTNQCGGDDDIDYASGAKLLNPGESFNTLLTLDGVTSPGDYYFKIVVYFGTEKSGASQLFTAVEEGAPTPAPAPSAPSGGGGGAAPITPPEIVKEEKPTGKLYLFNLNIDIISLRALTLLQNSIETNKEFLTSKQIFIDFSSLNPTRDELILETKTNITDFSSIKGEKDVVLEHSIEDPNGKVYVSSFETRKINNSEIVIKEIKIPARLLSVGNYLVVAKLTYNNETFIGRDVFAIVSKEPEAKIESISIWILIIVLILSIILVITIIRLIIKKQAYKRKIEQRLQEKESLKKVERYIKE